MTPQEEDSIKAKIYLKFQQKYFADREKKDGKTKAVHLSSEERLEFCRKQRLYVEEKYQEAINEEYGGKKNDPFMRKIQM